MTAQHAVVGVCVLVALGYALFRLVAQVRRLKGGAQAGCGACPASACSGCGSADKGAARWEPGQQTVSFVRQNKGNP